MNFLGNKLIPAALLAASATVIGTADPAQALSLKGGLSFAGAATIQSTGDGDDFFLDFAGPGFTLSSDGSFLNPDSISFSDFSIVDGALAGTVNPFITGILTTSGDVNFVLTKISSLMVNANSQSITFSLGGDFTNGLGDVVGRGSFSGEFGTVTKTFSGSLEAVPTPAAVLPIIGGLFGAASKRKRQEENA